MAKTTTEEPLTHVRIRPLNPKRGHTLRKYTHVPSGMRFEEERGWYVVDPKLAAYLATRRVVDGDEESLPMFDVTTKSGAEAIDERERVAEIRKGPAQANDLTTRDVATGTEGGGTRRRGMRAV